MLVFLYFHANSINVSGMYKYRTIRNHHSSMMKENSSSHVILQGYETLGHHTKQDYSYQVNLEC